MRDESNDWLNQQSTNEILIVRVSQIKGEIPLIIINKNIK